MRKVVLALCVAVIAATAVGYAQSATVRRNSPVLDFDLLNDTEYTIDELYLSPSNSSRWGKDVLGREVLKHGETVELKFSREETECSWDLKVVDEEEDEIVWEDIDLCKWSHVTLKWENGRAFATFK